MWSCFSYQHFVVIFVFLPQADVDVYILKLACKAVISLVSPTRETAENNHQQCTPQEDICGPETRL